jgi:hypothetical protein
LKIDVNSIPIERISNIAGQAADKTDLRAASWHTDGLHFRVPYKDDPAACARGSGNRRQDAVLRYVRSL